MVMMDSSIPEVASFLERVEKNSRIVAPHIEEITGMDLDFSQLEFAVDDGTLRNNDDVEFTKKQLGRLKSHMTLTDKTILHMKGAAVKAVMTGVSNWYLDKAALMTYNNGLVAVNPRYMDMPDKTMQCMLAHELVHPLDDQHTGIIASRLDLIKETVDSEIEEIAARHERGLYRGYISPDSDIEEMDARGKKLEKKITRLMTAIESHANYVQKKVVEEMEMQPTDMLYKGMIPMMLMSIPAMALPKTRKRSKLYKDGVVLIDLTYKANIPIAKVYENLPTIEDFTSPTEYVARRVAALDHVRN